jgi:putative transcriptional regulator
MGAELLQSVKEMKAGKKARVSTVTWVVQIRLKTKLSQAQFAKSIGVSVRTLQDWEQGRRHPSGPAMSLLKIVEKHPKTIRELAA